MAAERGRLTGFAGAVLVHVVLIGLLAYSMERKPEAPSSPATKPVIQARAVSEAEVMGPMRRRQAEQEAKRKAAEAAKRKAAEAAKRKAAEAAKRRAQEKARLAALRKKVEAEKARLAEQERQRKIEAERKASEEAKKRAAEEQARREAELKTKMAAEAERLAQEQQRLRQQQLNTVRAQYIADIANKVGRNWLRPTGSQGSQCRVVIQQMPGGEVIDVRTTECDGDVAFQRSVEAAVRKASPLPLPSEREVFDREIEFVFTP
jgi:colicin import membrane protein